MGALADAKSERRSSATAREPLGTPGADAHARWCVGGWGRESPGYPIGIKTRSIPFFSGGGDRNQSADPAHCAAYESCCTSGC